MCLLSKSSLFPIILAVLLLFQTSSYGNHTSVISGQLRNGLTYYIHHDPYAKKHISLDFIIRAGSLDEQEDERGFSHLIEHDILNRIQFKGKKISDDRCAIWDATCPQPGGMTSYAFTQYHLEISRAIPQGLEEGLLGFFNILSQGSLDEECLQQTKSEVLQEFDRSRLSPIECWQQWRLGQESPLYQNKNPLGSQKTISQASIDKLYPFYRSKYQPSHIGIIIVGNINLQKAVDFIEKYYGGLSGADEKEILRPDLTPVSKGVSIYTNNGLQNTFISLAKPIPRMSSRNFLILSILTQLLSQHLQSHSTTYQPTLDILTYPRMLRVTVSLYENFEKEMDQFSRAIKSFFKQSITEDQLTQIKAAMKNNLQILQETGSDPALIDFYREHFILRTTSLEADHPAFRATLLDTIRAEEVGQMLQDFQGFSHLSLGSPYEEAKHISTEFLSELFLSYDHSWSHSYVD